MEEKNQHSEIGNENRKITTDTKEIQQIIRTESKKFKVDQFLEIYGLPVLNQNQINYLSINLNINRKKLETAWMSINRRKIVKMWYICPMKIIQLLKQNHKICR